MKRILKKKVSRLESLTTEIELLRAVDHPHIIKVSGSWVMGDEWKLVDCAATII